MRPQAYPARVVLCLPGPTMPQLTLWSVARILGRQRTGTLRIVRTVGLAPGVAAAARGCRVSGAARRSDLAALASELPHTEPQLILLISQRNCAKGCFGRSTGRRSQAGGQLAESPEMTALSRTVTRIIEPR